jgi:hypothetical protein
MPSKTTEQEIAVIGYKANQAVPTELLVGRGVCRHLELHLSGVLNISSISSIAAIGNGPWNLIPNIRVRVDGKETIADVEFMDLAIHEETFFERPPETDITVAGTGDKPFSCRARVMFQAPHLAEQARCGLDMYYFRKIELIPTWGNVNSLISGGAATFSTDPTLRVIPLMGENDPAPEFVYKMLASEISSGTFTAAVTDRVHELVQDDGKFLQSLIVAYYDEVAATGRTLASTALTNIRLRQLLGSSNFNAFGLLTGEDMREIWHREYRRAVDLQDGLYPYSFMGKTEGRFGAALETGEGSDLRLLFDSATPSNTARVRVLEQILERYAR